MADEGEGPDQVGPDHERRGPHFEIHESIEVDATPEQVWEAIATGPGYDSWFMGRSEIEPKEGGRTTMTFLGRTSYGTVGAYEPGRRFKQTSDPNPDGTFMAMEYLVEGREGGSTVVRMVHSGFLGDDWETEYDGLRIGDAKYLRKLATYLKYFAGRTSTFDMFLVGPTVPDA
ncbi:SRPBCC domain-containing protein, partial [Actinomadura adrarensis]